MKLAEDAKYWKKLWSMRFLIATTFFSGCLAVYITFPDDWQHAIPSWLVKVIAGADFLTGGLGAVSRVVKQQIGDSNGSN